MGKRLGSNEFPFSPTLLLDWPLERLFLIKLPDKWLRLFKVISSESACTELGVRTDGFTVSLNFMLLGFGFKRKEFVLVLKSNTTNGSRGKGEPGAGMLGRWGKSTCCCGREPGFNSWRPHDGSQPSVTLALRGLAPSCDPPHLTSVHTHARRRWKAGTAKIRKGKSATASRTHMDEFH